MYTKSYTIVAMRGRNPDNPSERGRSNGKYRQRLEPNSGGVCNTITSVQKDNLVFEQMILTPKRTEYGKQIRKAYESGHIQESRHNMTTLEPRTDGISNTITTVTKDNIVMERMTTEDGQLLLKKERTSKEKPKGKGWSDLVEFADGRRGWFRLRKLTPRECLRLQGVPEHHIDTMLNAGISDSRLYMLAGNSICVPCMVGIFRNLFTTEEVESNTLF